VEDIANENEVKQTVSKKKKQTKKKIDQKEEPESHRALV
tara:strand:+ start:402 stop:518 length:117 start_codon:yes stop_codon:yes gene_type:complete